MGLYNKRLPNIILTDKEYNKLRSYCRKQKISDDDLHSALAIVYSKYTLDKITDNLIYVIARNLKNEQYRKDSKHPISEISTLSEASQMKLNLVEYIEIEPDKQYLYITDEQAELYKAIQEAFQQGVNLGQEKTLQNLREQGLLVEGFEGILL